MRQQKIGVHGSGGGCGCSGGCGVAVVAQFSFVSGLLVADVFDVALFLAVGAEKIAVCTIFLVSTGMILG